MVSPETAQLTAQRALPGPRAPSGSPREAELQSLETEVAGVLLGVEIATAGDLRVVPPCVPHPMSCLPLGTQPGKL